MILDLFIFITVVLSILVGWFELFNLPLWVVILPAALAYLTRFAALGYMRFSHSRWEAFKQMEEVEGEGVREFRDVMIGVILALIRREPTPTIEEMTVEEGVPEASAEDDEGEETPYSPPGFEDEEDIEEEVGE